MDGRSLFSHGIRFALRIDILGNTASFLITFPDKSNRIRTRPVHFLTFSIFLNNSSSVIMQNDDTQCMFYKVLCRNHVFLQRSNWVRLTSK